MSYVLNRSGCRRVYSGCTRNTTGCYKCSVAKCNCTRRTSRVCPLRTCCGEETAAVASAFGARITGCASVCDPCARNVIYQGPCPPDPDCETDCPTHPTDPPCYPPCQPDDATAYAYYAQAGTLAVTRAGNPVPISTVKHERSDTFSERENIVTILRTGTYMGSFTLTLPACAQLTRQFVLVLDGNEIPGSVLRVNKVPGAPDSAFVETVFTARAGQRLEILSDGPVNLTAETPLDVLASLRLLKLG